MYGSTPFRAKMIFLLLAIIFSFTAHRKLILSDPHRVSPLMSKLVALVSLILWAGVGIAGRAIGIT